MMLNIAGFFGVAAIFVFAQKTWVFLLSIFILLALYNYGRKYIADRYRGLLERRCDPVAHIGFFGEFEKESKSFYSKMACRMEIMKGLYYSGDAEAALSYAGRAVEVDALMPGDLVSFYCMAANCYCMLGNEQGLRLVAQKARSLSSNDRYGYYKGLEMIESHVESLVDFLHKDGEAVLSNIKNSVAYNGGRLSDISKAYMSACAFLWQGNTVSAIPLLEFVIENGGGLYYTERAVALLNQIKGE